MDLHCLLQELETFHTRVSFDVHVSLYSEKNYDGFVDVCETQAIASNDNVHSR
jgi:hypothetical protein